MTAKTPKDQDPDIIEGVAVEKSAPSGRRDRSGGKTGSSRQKLAAESSDAADQASASAVPEGAGTVCPGLRGRCPGDVKALLPAGWVVERIEPGRGCLVVSIAGQSWRRCIT